jgi:hypothetical protein
LAGGVPGQGVVAEGVKGIMLPGIYKNSTKNGWLPALVDLEIAKTPFLYSKVLNKMYSQDFFDVHMNF